MEGCQRSLPICYWNFNQNPFGTWEGCYGMVWYQPHGRKRSAPIRVRLSQGHHVPRGSRNSGLHPRPTAASAIFPFDIAILTKLLLGPGKAASAPSPFDIVILTKIRLQYRKAASSAFPFDIVILTRILLGPGKAASAAFPFEIVILTKILVGLGKAASTGLKY